MGYNTDRKKHCDRRFLTVLRGLEIGYSAVYTVSQRPSLGRVEVFEFGKRKSESKPTEVDKQRNQLHVNTSFHKEAEPPAVCAAFPHPLRGDIILPHSTEQVNNYRPGLTPELRQDALLTFARESVIITTTKLNTAKTVKERVARKERHSELRRVGTGRGEVG